MNKRILMYAMGLGFVLMATSAVHAGVGVTIATGTPRPVVKPETQQIKKQMPLRSPRVPLRSPVDLSGEPAAHEQAVQDVMQIVDQELAKIEAADADRATPNTPEELNLPAAPLAADAERATPGTPEELNLPAAPLAADVVDDERATPTDPVVDANVKPVEYKPDAGAAANKEIANTEGLLHFHQGDFSPDTGFFVGLEKMKFSGATTISDVDRTYALSRVTANRFGQPMLKAMAPADVTLNTVAGKGNNPINKGAEHGLSQLILCDGNPVVAIAGDGDAAKHVYYVPTLRGGKTVLTNQKSDMATDYQLKDSLGADLTAKAHIFDIAVTNKPTQISAAREGLAKTTGTKNAIFVATASEQKLSNIVGGAGDATVGISALAVQKDFLEPLKTDHTDDAANPENNKAAKIDLADGQIAAVGGAATFGANADINLWWDDRYGRLFGTLAGLKPEADKHAFGVFGGKFDADQFKLEQEATLAAALIDSATEKSNAASIFGAKADNDAVVNLYRPRTMHTSTDKDYLIVTGGVETKSYKGSKAWVNALPLVKPGVADAGKLAKTDTTVVLAAHADAPKVDRTAFSADDIDANQTPVVVGRHPSFLATVAGETAAAPVVLAAAKALQPGSLLTPGSVIRGAGDTKIGKNSIIQNTKGVDAYVLFSNMTRFLDDTVVKGQLTQNVQYGDKTEFGVGTKMAADVTVAAGELELPAAATFKAEPTSVLATGSVLKGTFKVPVGDWTFDFDGMVIPQGSDLKVNSVFTSGSKIEAAAAATFAFDAAHAKATVGYGSQITFDDTKDNEFNVASAFSGELKASTAAGAATPVASKLTVVSAKDITLKGAAKVANTTILAEGSLLVNPRVGAGADFIFGEAVTLNKNTVLPRHTLFKEFNGMGVDYPAANVTGAPANLDAVKAGEDQWVLLNSSVPNAGKMVAGPCKLPINAQLKIPHDGKIVGTAAAPWVIIPNDTILPNGAVIHQAAGNDLSLFIKDAATGGTASPALAGLPAIGGNVVVDGASNRIATGAAGFYLPADCWIDFSGAMLAAPAYKPIINGVFAIAADADLGDLGNLNNLAAGVDLTLDKNQAQRFGAGSALHDTLVLKDGFDASAAAVTLGVGASFYGGDLKAGSKLEKNSNLAGLTVADGKILNLGADVTVTKNSELPRFALFKKSATALGGATYEKLPAGAAGAVGGGNPEWVALKWTVATDAVVTGGNVTLPPGGDDVIKIAGNRIIKSELGYDTYLADTTKLPAGTTFWNKTGALFNTDLQLKFVENGAAADKFNFSVAGNNLAAGAHITSDDYVTVRGGAPYKLPVGFEIEYPATCKPTIKEDALSNAAGRIQVGAKGLAIDGDITLREGIPSTLYSGSTIAQYSTPQPAFGVAGATLETKDNALSIQGGGVITVRAGLIDETAAVKATGFFLNEKSNVSQVVVGEGGFMVTTAGTLPADATLKKESKLIDASIVKADATAVTLTGNLAIGAAAQTLDADSVIATGSMLAADSEVGGGAAVQAKGVTKFTKNPAGVNFYDNYTINTHAGTVTFKRGSKVNAADGALLKLAGKGAMMTLPADWELKEATQIITLGTDDKGANPGVGLTTAQFDIKNDSVLGIGSTIGAGSYQLTSNSVYGFSATDLQVIGDSVYIALEGDRSEKNGVEAGIFKSTAVFDDEGKVRGWTPWRRMGGSTDAAAFFGYNQSTGNVIYLTSPDGKGIIDHTDPANPKVINPAVQAKLTGWSAGDNAKATAADIKNKVDNSLHSGSSLGSVLQQAFAPTGADPDTYTGVYGLVDFDADTLGFAPYQRSNEDPKFSCMVATGNERVAITQTGVYDATTSNFKPTQAFTLGENTFVFDAATDGAAGKKAAGLKGLGRITCAEFTRNATGENYLFVGGENGLAVLKNAAAAKIGHGVAADAVAKTGLDKLDKAGFPGTDWAFVKLVDNKAVAPADNVFKGVRKITADQATGYVYVATKDNVFRIRPDSSIFKNADGKIESKALPFAKPITEFGYTPIVSRDAKAYAGPNILLGAGPGGDTITDLAILKSTTGRTEDTTLLLGTSAGLFVNSAAAITNAFVGDAGAIGGVNWATIKYTEKDIVNGAANADLNQSAANQKAAESLKAVLRLEPVNLHAGNRMMVAGADNTFEGDINVYATNQDNKELRLYRLSANNGEAKVVKGATCTSGKNAVLPYIAKLGDMDKELLADLDENFFLQALDAGALDNGDSLALPALLDALTVEDAITAATAGASVLDLGAYYEYSLSIPQLAAVTNSASGAVYLPTNAGVMVNE